MSIVKYEAPSSKGSIEILPIEANKTYVVEKTFTVSTRFKKSVTVPVGFVTDYFTFAPDLKNSLYAAIVHDWLYATHKFADGTNCSKWQADLILYDLINETIDCAWAWVYWTGVAVGGLIPWFKDFKKGPKYVNSRI